MPLAAWDTHAININIRNNIDPMHLGKSTGRKKAMVGIDCQGVISCRNYHGTGLMSPAFFKHLVNALL